VVKEAAMAEKEAGGTKKKGWFKALLGTAGGLISGAAVMYATPLVNKAIQPPKPVANFKVETPDGLTVRFQNLSTAGKGDWDFGDGSPLQPVTSEHESITHKFPGPGDYSVKLTVQNILNEENERTVSVKLAATSVEQQRPQIARFTVVPLISGNVVAPASFQLSCEVHDAQVCVWAISDGRVKVVHDTAPNHDHVVVFPKAGHYTLRVVAVNGAGDAERAAEVDVMDPPSGPGVAKAIVTVTDAGTRLERRPPVVTTIHARFPQQQRENVLGINREVRVSTPGCTIGDVVIPVAGNKEIRMGSNTAIALDARALGQPAARNLRLTLAPDRLTLKVTGELVRDNPASAPALVLPLEIIEQREVGVGPTEVQLTRALGLPGMSTFPSTDAVALPPLPPDWTAANRQVRVELDDGQTRVVNPSVVPISSAAVVQGRSVVFSAVRVKDQVNLSLTAPSVIRPGTGGD
jgi:PKD repeat protein